MKNEKFKNLILSTYKAASEGHLMGILYTAVSTHGFSDIRDIDGFVENCNPDMLYLKSTLTGDEISVYEWDLEKYRFDVLEHRIYIKCKNKMEVKLIY